MKKTVLHIFCIAAAAAFYTGLAGVGSIAEAFTISGRIVVVGGSGCQDAVVWIDHIHTARTDSLGDYAIGGLLNGKYAVKVWAERCLASVVDTVTVQYDNVAGVNDTIVAADIVEDGRINLYDAGELLRHYRATPDSVLWDEGLDFDGSGVIDSLDTAVLMRCWKDTSDVAPPSFLEVMEPSGATIWHVGQPAMPIRWNTGGLLGPVSISLLWDNDLIDEITPSTPNDGSFTEYDVPPGLSPGSEYRILVYHIDSGASGLSEYFEIRRSIAVTIPASSTVWNRGQKGVTVAWVTGGFSGYVSIYLYKGNTQVKQLSWGESNNGLRWVDVPADIPLGSDYRIQVFLDADHNDFGDYFTIQDPSLVITAPDGNTAWLRGQQDVAIRWESSFMTGSAAIGLYRGGILVEMIAASTPNDGEYSGYNVPALLVPGADYQIQIDSDDGRHVLSDNFEIVNPSGWSWLYPSTEGHHLNSVCFTDANTGTTVGEYGTILRTTDGGATWVRQWGSTRKKLYGVAFRDANTGLAVGEGGLILKTTDGGMTWVSKAKGLRDRGYQSVAFADADTAVAVGWGPGVVFCRSTDGGETWTSSIIDTYTFPRSVSFFDAKIGVAAANEGAVYWTNDGGATWNRRRGAWAGDYYPDSKGTGISLLDANTWVVTGWERYDTYFYGLDYRGVIAITRDAGASWQRTLWSALPNSISFADARNGTVVGEKGGIFGTTDGGATWVQRASGLSTALLAVSFGDDNTGMAVGAYGMISKTTDGGATWILQTPATTLPLIGISFSDENRGVIVGGSGTRGVILGTTDGGATWSSQGTSGGALGSISMANADTGVAVGSYVDCGGCDAGFPPTYWGVILRTIDGGATWATQSSPRLLLRGLWLLDSKKGIAFGDGDSYAADDFVVLRTQDGGAAWTSQPFAFSINDVWFSDANTGTAIGVQGVILRTSDGGATWIQQTSGTTGSLTAVHFSDSNTGTVVGSYGVILRTVDGGVTWIPQTSGTARHLLGVRFVDANTGMVVGVDGTILRTTDGGITWIKQDGWNAYDFNFVHLWDANTAIVGGESGVILKTTTGGE